MRGTTQSRPNNSLDASGTSGLVIDNWSVTWLSPAASTQPLGRAPSFTVVQLLVAAQLMGKAFGVTRPVRHVGNTIDSSMKG